METLDLVLLFIPLEVEVFFHTIQVKKEKCKGDQGGCAEEVLLKKMLKAVSFSSLG